jgi:hypothetical protein
MRMNEKGERREEEAMRKEEGGRRTEEGGRRKEGGMEVHTAAILQCESTVLGLPEATLSSSTFWMY